MIHPNPAGRLISGLSDDSGPIKIDSLPPFAQMCTLSFAPMWCFIPVELVFPRVLVAYHRPITSIYQIGTLSLKKSIFLLTVVVDRL